MQTMMSSLSPFARPLTACLTVSFIMRLWTIGIMGNWIKEYLSGRGHVRINGSYSPPSRSFLLFLREVYVPGRLLSLLIETTASTILSMTCPVRCHTPILTFC